MRSIIKVLSVFSLGLSLLVSSMAFSHSDHGAPLNDVQAISKATEYVGMIVEKPELMAALKLDSSWKKVTDKKVHKKSVRYFIVSLHNASQKKTLYVLLSTYGELYDANFSGVFKGL